MSHGSKELEEQLHRIFTLVNDWLKFAEAKNGALFALSGAGIAAILGFFSAKETLSFHWKAGLFSGLVALGVAAVFAIVSFLPRIRFMDENYGKPAEADNLIFFGSLAKYKDKEDLLVDRIRDWYVLNGEPTRKIHRDLAQQIVNNSQITLQKYKWASRSVWAIVIAGTVSIGVPSIILIFQSM